MKIGNEASVPRREVKVEGAVGATIQWLIAEPDGAPNFAMRRFVIAPDGHTPYHSHDDEHEVFVLSGKGKAFYEGSSTEISTGSFVFIEGGAMHNFVNDGSEDLVFLCIIPNTKK